VGTSIVQFLCFWVVSALYVALPYVVPEYSAQHKLQKAEKQPSPSDLLQCFTVVARNQIISTLLHIAVITFRLKQPIFRLDAKLPSLLEIFRDIALTAVLHDVLFYYVHRIFHHPSLYPAIHKLHHRFVAPVALAAQYATVTEHIFSNLMPVLLPMMILNVHVVTFWIVLGLGLVQTTTGHSGFDFFAGKARAHDLHHEKFLVNFGSTGLVDWLHGTNRIANDRSR